MFHSTNLWQATIALSNGNLLSIFLHPIALLRVGRQILIKTLSVFGHSLSQQRSSEFIYKITI